MGTLMAGEDGRDLSVSKGNSRRGFFFFSASRSRVSPEVRLGLSARIKMPVRKSTISSWEEKKKKSQTIGQLIRKHLLIILCVSCQLHHDINGR